MTGNPDLNGMTIDFKKMMKGRVFFCNSAILDGKRASQGGLRWTAPEVTRDLSGGETLNRFWEVLSPPYLVLVINRCRMKSIINNIEVTASGRQ